MELVYFNHIDYSSYEINLVVMDPICAITKVSASSSTCTSTLRDVDYSYIMCSKSVRREYTLFEVFWKYLFLIVTLCILFWPEYGYIYRLVRIQGTSQQEKWSPQQKWVLSLLLGLVMMDDPLFAIQVFGVSGSTSTGLAVFSTLCVTTELGALLCYWLVTFGHLLETSLIQRQFGLESIEMIRQRGGDTPVQAMDPYCASTCPKYILSLVLWAAMASAYTFLSYQEHQDPTFYLSSDLGQFDQLVRAFQVFLGMYCAWLAYLVFRTCLMVPRMAAPHILVHVTTVLTVILTCTGLYLGAYFSKLDEQENGVLFLLFYAMTNVYIWILAAVFSPLNTHSEITCHDEDEVSDFDFEIEMA